MQATTDLSSRPNGRITARVVVGSAVAAAVATGATLVATPILPELLGLLPVLMSTAATSATFAALLLHLLTNASGRTRGHERWAAAGLAITAAAMWMQVLGFPAIDLDGGPFRTTDSGAASLYFAWHTALPLFVLAGCSGLESSRLARRVAAVAAIAGCVWLSIGALPGPTWFSPDRTYLPASYVMMWFDVGLTLVAIWAWVRRTGPRPLWTEAAITAALVFATWDVGLRTIGTMRFTPWWWASLLMRIASVAVPVLWLGFGTAALQRRLNVYVDGLERSYDDQLDTNRTLTDRNDDLDAFARTVAHDLRSPLTVSTGLVETVLRHHQLPEQTRYLLDRALHRQRDQASMLDGLLRLALAGDGQLSLGANDLAMVVDRVVTTTGVSARVEVDADDPVLADPAALSAIVQNLLTNAAAHAGAGRTVHVHLAARTTPEGRVEITVDDDGPGIPVELREHIFSPFTRGEARDGNGAGLGLAIVQRLIERHGGTVVAEAAPTGGARFRFDLPAVPPEPATPVPDPIGVD